MTHALSLTWALHLLPGRQYIHSCMAGLPDRRPLTLHSWPVTQAPRLRHLPPQDWKPPKWPAVTDAKWQTVSLAVDTGEDIFSDVLGGGRIPFQGRL